MQQGKHFAIIGAGISGLSMAHMLSAKGFNVIIFEKENAPGGLVRCERVHEAHRIICTGNFATSNSPAGMSTATIEFTEEMCKSEILEQLQRIPFSPKYITHRYTPCTYPVQDVNTRRIIDKVKNILEPHNFYLLGRFAEWEYYNMDAAMGAAMKLCSQLEP